MQSFKGFYPEVTDINDIHYQVGQDNVVAIRIVHSDPMWGHTFAVYYHEKKVPNIFEQMRFITVSPNEIT